MMTTAFRQAKDRNRVYLTTLTTRHILIAGTCNQETGQRNNDRYVSPLN